MYQSSQSDRDAGPSGSVPRASGSKTVHYSEEGTTDVPLLYSSDIPIVSLPPARIFRQPSINQGYMESSNVKPVIARQESRTVNIDQNLRIHPIAGTSDWRSFSFSGQFHHLILRLLQSCCVRQHPLPHILPVYASYPSGRSSDGRIGSGTETAFGVTRGKLLQLSYCL